ncbi:MAG: hypothetical protein ACYTBR_05480 [Planctomycetota bacterium]
MRIRQVIIGAFGAVLTGVTALVAYDALGFVPIDVVGSLPDPVLGAAPWAWKVLAALVVVYFVVSIVWSRRGKPGARAPRRLEVSIELDLSEPPDFGQQRSLPQPPAPYIAHPYLLADGFTGRFPEREDLTAWLRKKRSAPVRALVSVGGMGKSALAWVWMHQDVLGEELPQIGQDPPDVRSACRVSAESRPQGVMWWSFGQPGAGFSAFLDEALVYLSGGAVRPTSYLSSRAEKLESLLDLLRDGRFLLILDGFERELRAFASLGAPYQGDEHAGGSRGDERLCSDLHAAEFLRRLAAQQIASRVLLTTRLLPAELANSGGSDSGHRELGGLEPMDAVSFLQGMGIRGESQDIEAACGRYRFHPLALRLLAGVLRGSAETGDIRAAGRVRVPARMKDREHHHIVEVALGSLTGRAAALASHLAVFRCPVTSAQASGQEGVLKGALGMLIVRGLVTFDARRDRYDLHPVVRQHAYECLPQRDPGCPCSSPGSMSYSPPSSSTTTCSVPGATRRRSRCFRANLPRRCVIVSPISRYCRSSLGACSAVPTVRSLTWPTGRIRPGPSASWPRRTATRARRGGRPPCARPTWRRSSRRASRSRWSSCWACWPASSRGWGAWRRPRRACAASWSSRAAWGGSRNKRPPATGWGCCWRTAPRSMKRARSSTPRSRR